MRKFIKLHLLIVSMFTCLALSFASHAEVSGNDFINVSNFSADAAVSMFSYNFANYKKLFDDHSKYFTERSWSQYRKMLKNSRELETVINKKLVVSAVPSDVPMMIGESQKQGQSIKKIQVPLLVVYRGPSSALKQNILVTLEVVPAAEGRGVRNLMVDAFTLKPI